LSMSNYFIFIQGTCHICKRIFCCGKCRQKHQFNVHAIAVREPLGVSSNTARITEHRMQMESGVTTIYVFCPICEQRPLLLQEEMHGELLAHIETCHLPLRCRKCKRNYTHIADLREFSKCVDRQQDCSGASTINDQTCDTDASKVTVKKAPNGNCGINSTTISTQTSPGVTPISVINMHWKAKNRITHEEFISDSVSSIRNLSSFSSCGNSSIRRSIGQLVVNPPETVVKGKIIRSTSTPLQVESVFAKPKEPITFNASNGGHMSSIYQEESSPAAENNLVQQPLQQRTWKMNGRNKMSAATPLRQVMSKSIQKAFVEHGGMLTQPPSGVIQRRVRLDLSDHNNHSTEGGPAAGGSSALDLRLSPAMRRTQSESSASGASTTSCSEAGDPYKRPLILSAQKLTTESIIITRTNSNLRETSSTVYNSCESVEIIRSTSESAELHVPPITPLRVSGTGINKKQIKFETPPKSRHLQVIDHGNGDGEECEESSEHFYTPNPGTPELQERRRQATVARQLTGDFSPNKEKAKEAPITLKSTPLQRPKPRPPLRECQQAKAFSGVQDVGETEDDEDEVFLPTDASTRNDKKQEPGTGRLWSLMSSMMRLPASLRGDKENATTVSGSLIRRCASIAGSLVRPGSRDGGEKADAHPLKRKRTQTLDSQYNTDLSPSSASTSKRYRIRPRDPIERMRQN
ncbi:hypothetical protein KR038_005179, partial [Drosophila bunnanda]